MSTHAPWVQWSLLELVVVLTIGVVVLGSIWAPPIFLNLVLAGFMLLVFSLLAIAWVGRGSWRTFATGFCCFSFAYLAALVLVETGQSRLFQGVGQLPTTSLMITWQSSLTRTQYIKDGQPISDELKPTMDNMGNVIDADGNTLGSTIAMGGGGFFAGGGPGTPVPAIYVKQTPNYSTYMTLGHVFWTLLLGYLGGKFAVGFRRFQDNQETAPPSDE